MELKINDNKKIITIRSVNDLMLLPDKSIKLLFNNSNYMTTIYLYVVYKVDIYLQYKEYSNMTRVKYFNICMKNLKSFTEYEKEFLLSNNTSFSIKLERFPKEFERIHRESIISTCNFFRGMLSTTSLLDKDLLPSREDKQILRHNYGNMASTLLDSVGG